MVESFLYESGDNELLLFLKANNILREKFQMHIDLHGSNSLERCFDKQHP